MPELIRFLGIDYGSKRVGLSHGDSELGIAMPLPMILNGGYRSLWKDLRHVFLSHPWDVFVVGYPFHMDGSIGAKAKEVDAFMVRLEQEFALPVMRSDETLTSEEALHRFQNSRKMRLRNVTHWQHFRRTGEIDSGAAVLILQDHLNALMQRDPNVLLNNIDDGD
ncbi:MAG: Holliday junction resolvase RuvX [Puniceicoccales bacterium]|jgi:putative Holliday junction resolvase|nr:Holliday junction resolvase RuvX [Puniceicoccales bacterium]